MERVIFLLCAFSAVYLAFEVIPERHEIIYVNPKYVRDVKVSVRRAGRQAKYVLNIDGVVLHLWERNVTLQYAFFEHRQNEYKPSFVDVPEMNYCDSIKFILFRKTLEKTMLRCPLPAGEVHLKNLTLLIDDFPYKWPFEKCKVRLTIRVPKDNSIALIGDLYLFLKQRVTVTKKPKNIK